MPAAGDFTVATTRAMHVPAISWVHPPGGFLGLSMLNGVLRILTLGVYHFWGKTEVRQRIWSAVRIDGEPLDYRGTGGELFRGFLIVFFLILLPMVLARLRRRRCCCRIARARESTRSASGAYCSCCPASASIARAATGCRARAGAASAAACPGARGGFAWTYLWTMLLIPVTLGWIVPWRTVRLQKALFDDTRFGDKAFTFSGRAGPLYRRFWLVWSRAIVSSLRRSAAIFAIVGVAMRAASGASAATKARFTGGKMSGRRRRLSRRLLVFAIIRAWYSARMLNYFAIADQFQGTAFTLAATASAASFG